MKSILKRENSQLQIALPPLPHIPMNNSSLFSFKSLSVFVLFDSRQKMRSNSSDSCRPMEDMTKADDEARFDIWSSIQKVKEKEIRTSPEAEWPQDTLLRRFSSLMSQHSLELCTEGLGSETGSDGFSSADELDCFFSPFSSKTHSFTERREQEESAAKIEIQGRGNEMIRANHHCFNGRQSPPFPPPLSSGCTQMKSVRSDGRLVLTAVPVPCHNHLHAERHGGRLLLSFVNTDFQSNAINHLQEQRNLQIEEEDDGVEAEEEKEVQVLDSGAGAMVVVKVSAHPQLVNDTATVKSIRSSLVISTFVRRTPPAAAEEDATQAVGAKRLTATAAASVVTLTSDGFQYSYLQLHHPHPWCSQNPPAPAEEVIETKVLLALKWGSREDVERDMRRSKKLRRPHFNFYIRETILRCCILLN